ncbi:MAG: pilus assembly protein [Pirellulales bacterium]|nr:pilus assembly protein [Pirellulales bacterium]
MNHKLKRQGQALVEMAFLIPLVVIIIGATISFGLFFFHANVLQQAVDVAAQEIARFPRGATRELGLGDLSAADTTVMYDADFRAQIYDERFLVIDDTEWDQSTPFGGDFTAYMDQLPLLNRLLATTMVRDETIGGGVTRFPGAIVSNDLTGEQTVLIPIIGYDRATGAESLIEWVAPVEEIRPNNGQGPYSISAVNTAAAFSPGMVALRINYPAQSTTLINRTGDDGEVIIAANDAALADGNTGTNYSLVVGAESGVADTTIHSGRFGLGRQAALLRAGGVRPYRKVISVQAIYRREVFQ